MRKPIAHKNDRVPVKRKNMFTPEARERVVEGLVASATADFVALVRWLKSDKGSDATIPLARCESLRTTISHLVTLKSGVNTDWKNVLKLVENRIKASHNLTEVVPPPSKIATGVLGHLNEISREIASGKATPEMLTRLMHMKQITSSLKGSEDLSKSIDVVIETAQNVLRGFRKQQSKPKISKPAKPAPALRDEKEFREECEFLIGLNDIFSIASCLISMSERLGLSPVNLAKRAAALKGVINPGILPELLDLLQQDVEMAAVAVPIRVKEDNSRSDGGKLVGLTGVVEGGVSIGIEAQRIITAELKKGYPLTAAQRVSFDTARASLALESDTFKVIEDIRRIAAHFNWRPLAVAAFAAHKTPGIRPDIAADVITLLAQDEVLSNSSKVLDRLSTG